MRAVIWSKEVNNPNGCESVDPGAHLISYEHLRHRSKNLNLKVIKVKLLQSC